MLVVVTDVSTPLAVVIFRVKWRALEYSPLGILSTEYSPLDSKDDYRQGVETSVTTTNTNSPSQDYTNLDDQLQTTFNDTRRFKPFTLHKRALRFLYVRNDWYTGSINLNQKEKDEHGRDIFIK